MTMSPNDAHAIDAEASRWMKRGMALVQEATDSSLAEALQCFDEAIALRTTLVLEGLPTYRFGLAAGWLNRGEALVAMRTPDALQVAIDAFDVALDMLAPLPLDEDPRVRRRVAIAWHHRGLALRDLGRWEDSAVSLRRAAETIAGDVAAAIVDRERMLATISTNQALVLMSTTSHDAAVEARHLAQAALARLPVAEAADDLDAARLALSARHALCQANAQLLAAPGLASDASRELVSEATDAVDEGLALARSWEQRGHESLRGLAYDLVRFGARVYSIYQPHFLHEFIVENLDPAQSSGNYVGSPEMRAAALESLWLSFQTHTRDSTE